MAAVSPHSVTRSLGESHYPRNLQGEVGRRHGDSGCIGTTTPSSQKAKEERIREKEKEKEEKDASFLFVPLRDTTFSGIYSRNH